MERHRIHERIYEHPSGQIALGLLLGAVLAVAAVLGGLF